MVRVSARTRTVPTVACHGFPQSVQKNAQIIRVSTEQLPSRCLPVHHSQTTPQQTPRIRAMSDVDRQRVTAVQWHWNGAAVTATNRILALVLSGSFSQLTVHRNISGAIKDIMTQHRFVGNAVCQQATCCVTVITFCNVQCNYIWNEILCRDFLYKMATADFWRKLETLLMASRKADVTNKHGWNVELASEFSVMSVIANLNKVCQTLKSFCMTPC
jgi:hypothetical protein